MSVQLGQRQTRGGVAMPMRLLSVVMSLFSVLVTSNEQHPGK